MESKFQALLNPQVYISRVLKWKRHLRYSIYSAICTPMLQVSVLTVLPLSSDTRVCSRVIRSRSLFGAKSGNICGAPRQNSSRQIVRRIHSFDSTPRCHEYPQWISSFFYLSKWAPRILSTTTHIAHSRRDRSRRCDVRRCVSVYFARIVFSLSVCTCPRVISFLL